MNNYEIVCEKHFLSQTFYSTKVRQKGEKYLTAHKPERFCIEVREHKEGFNGK